jgi:methanogenic corrinoid protein MtbC1
MATHFIEVCECLEDNKTLIARMTADQQFAHNPELEKKYGKSGKERCLQDNQFHLQYLIESVRFNNPDLFNKYLQWASGMLESRKIPISDLKRNLFFISSACRTLLNDNAYNITGRFLESGLAALENVPSEPQTYLLPEHPLHDEAKHYLKLLLKADRQGARVLLNSLLANGQSITDIYEYIFQLTQYEIGLLWQTNKISVTHEHYCTAVTQTLMAGLYNVVLTGHGNSKKMVGCAVSGELHEVGIRMLTDFFEVDGWDTYYLGANMPDNNLITALCDQEANLLCISATSPFHLGKVESLITKVRNVPQLNQMKILVGGYSFNTTLELWKQVGADGHALNARQAIKLANTLI